MVTENKSNSGYLCFLIAAKFLEIQVPSEFENKFQNTRDIYQEIISTAKKLQIKVSAGKLSKKRLIRQMFQ